MFFFLSKFLQYLYSPLFWAIICFILAIVLKKDKAKKFFKITSFVLILVFSNPFLANMMLGIWETERAEIEKLEPRYSYGIVLTGMISQNSADEPINFGNSTDRILYALQLYHAGRIDKIYISGGSGLVFGQEQKESELLKNYLVSINVPAEDIIIETESKNTYENAQRAAEILQPTSNNDTYLLITSASHFRRSAKCFEAAGFAFDAFPVDQNYVSPSFVPDAWLIPQISALATWNMLFHEMVGYVIYDWCGHY